jgi:hypothetical protein
MTWFRQLLPLISPAKVPFWAAPKVTQPVKSGDHNTGHSFLGIMNKVTRRRNPWTIKTAIHSIH